MSLVVGSRARWVFAAFVGLAAADTHIPYAPSLEEAILPNAEDVVVAARKLAEY